MPQLKKSALSSLRSLIGWESRGDVIPYETLSKLIELYNDRDSTSNRHPSPSFIWPGQRRGVLKPWWLLRRKMCSEALMKWRLPLTESHHRWMDILNTLGADTQSAPRYAAWQYRAPSWLLFIPNRQPLSFLWLIDVYILLHHTE